MNVIFAVGLIVCLIALALILGPPKCTVCGGSLDPTEGDYTCTCEEDWH